MGFVDRTPELRQLIAELAARGDGPKVGGQVAAPPPQAQSELNAQSADIGTGIHSASLKVEELRGMAKKKRIFIDQTAEIQALIFGVREDIRVLTQKLEAFEARAKGAGPNRSYQDHSKNVVAILKTRLMEVTRDFKDALEDRTKALERQDTRRRIYSPGQSSAANPFAQRQVPAPCGNSDDLEGGGGAQAVMQTTGYHASRADAVQNVQKTIGEMAQIFQRAAVLVTAQEEMIQRIDSDVDNTFRNVDAAQENLLRYFKHISSNRALIIKAFLVLIFFVSFFVVFVA